MVVKNGVSELFGKLLARKSGSSAHSTQLCKSTKVQQPFNPPFMAESCGGCDDNEKEIHGRSVVGGF